MYRLITHKIYVKIFPKFLFSENSQFPKFSPVPFSRSDSRQSKALSNHFFLHSLLSRLRRLKDYSKTNALLRLSTVGKNKQFLYFYGSKYSPYPKMYSFFSTLPYERGFLTWKYSLESLRSIYFFYL